MYPYNHSNFVHGTTFSVWPFMIGNDITSHKAIKRSSLKRFSYAIFACAFLTLSGCSGFQFPNIFSSKSKAETALKDEVAYIEEKRKEAKSEVVKTANPKNLFGSSLRSDEERINRLERAVQDMRNEFDSVQPSIRRLSALEGEIQTLIRELRTLNGTEAPVVASAPQPRPQQLNNAPAPRYQPPANTVRKTFQKKTPPAMTGKATVYDLRVGEHPNKTRIVMDSNAKTGFSIDVDNGERIAVIDLPNAGWSATKAKSFARSKFISSYNVESSGNGHILILKLKRNVRVSYKDDLKGTTSASRRMVIDLAGS